ncbi:hypothetical protein LJC23_06220 [Desulfovibrio sp. OttesenSCG-928-I05]|nr:hypothetical protein [Desulfovibrio sp. OttesenSCG-928-I05]
MSAPTATDPKLLEAFHLMWDAYPGPASLVHASKRILAVNDACREGGRVPGMVCSTWPSPDNHRGCMAQRALAEQVPFFKEVRRPGGVFRVYWLPVAGYPDCYVHFTTQTITLDTTPEPEAP